MAAAPRARWSFRNLSTSAATISRGRVDGLVAFAQGVLDALAQVANVDAAHVREVVDVAGDGPRQSQVDDQDVDVRPAEVPLRDDRRRDLDGG